MHRYQKLKLKILTPVLLSFVIFFLSATAGFYYVEQNNLNIKISSLMNRVQDLYRDRITQEADKIRGLITQIENNQHIINSWFLKDRNRLYYNTEGLYKTLNREYDITHLYFIEPDRTCFLRVHNRERFGDRIDRFTMNSAEKLKKTSYGIELGPFGTFTLRVVKPWIINGKIAGYLEIGEEIEHFIHDVKKVLDVDIIVSIKKAFLKKEMWEEGLIMIGRKGNWGQIEDYAITDRTLTLLPEKLDLYFNLLKFSTEPNIIYIKDDIRYNNRTYRGGFIPLMDAGHQHIGYTLVVADISKDNYSIINLIIYLVLISIILGTAVFISFFIYIGNIERTIEDAQNKLIQARKEEEYFKHSKIEALGVFAGGIAHDFNNLLTAITGNISLAISGIDKSNEMYDVLHEAEIASNRARGLTKQLLTFSKGGDPIKKTVSISSLIKDTVDLILSGSEIEKKITIPGNVYNLYADEGQVSQVLHNIILNARQAMSDKGVLSISAENINAGSPEIPVLLMRNHVKVTIADNGPGISNDIIDNIYDPYYTNKENGTGLGLTVVYSIIKKHNGSIKVHSEKGKGTVFVIYLPATNSASDGKIPVSELVNIKNKRILMLDDEEMVLKVGSRMLEKLGCKVSCVKDGRDAIEEYKKAGESGSKFDAVLMDLTIPGGMGGHKAIEILRIYDPDIRAIVSSGYSNDPLMGNYKEYGFRGVIAKPYRLDELREVLISVLK